MSGEGGLKVVAFALAEVRFALPATQVAALRPSGNDEPGLLPVEDLLGLPRDLGGPRQVLVLRVGGALATVTVPGAVRIDHVPASAIHPLPTLLRRHCAVRGLAALALDAGGLRLVVDTGGLVPATPRPAS